MNASSIPTEGSPENAALLPSADSKKSLKASWLPWYVAMKGILPVYIAIHLAFFVITCFTTLFTLKAISGPSYPISTLWQSWYHWDTANYIRIAAHGYEIRYDTAFFPLYPLLERCLMFLGLNPLIAGLLISEIAGLVLLLVLYRLVQEDFDQERAYHTVLYLSIFPSAFFLAAGYNEALFICLTVLSFYCMRHGQWWLAGLFGLFASLTRFGGALLLIPFCYEYLRQHEFQMRKIRFDMLGGVLIPSGIALYGVYCFFSFQDFLAFSHVQSHWGRSLHTPWYGIIHSSKIILTNGGLLNFQSLHNMLDLGSDLLILTLILLSFIGPWKFPGKLRLYSIYAAILYLFLQLFPTGGVFPLESTSRFMLEIFPAFIVLASIGARFRTVHLSYLMISGALVFFLLTQFLTGYWVV